MMANLSRTRDAIREYDKLDEEFDRLAAMGELDDDETVEWLNKIDESAKDVGRAYAEDTKEFNRRVDCEAFIRPGSRSAVEKSFARRMVDLWEEEAR